jgi:cation diffusion facilitator family transporter
MASGESRALVLLALTANSLIAVLKFIAAAISGSAAMLAEAFQVPFGRGTELYFWSFMVAVVLFVGGGVVAFMQGLDRIRHPHHDDTGLTFNLIVLGIAAAFEIFIAFIPAIREFNRRRGGRSVWRTIRDSKDPALLVVLFEDSVAVLGIVVAVTGLLLADATGDPMWDGIASIVIGLLLTLTAWLLAFETKGLLVGEAASRRVRSEIRAAALSFPEVVSVDRLLTMHLGPHEVLVNMDIVVDDGLQASHIEQVVDTMETRIREFVPDATRIFIEVGRHT